MAGAATAQVRLGILLTRLAIQLMPAVVARGGWQAPFALLAVGPEIGIPGLWRLPASAR